MSPTATIATVIAALILFAWLFQSETRDPGYEAWRKRQLEEKRNDGGGREVAGAAVTDPKAETEPRSLDEIRREREMRLSGVGGNAAAPVPIDVINPTGEGGDPFRAATVSGTGEVVPGTGQSEIPDPHLTQEQKAAAEKGFPKNHQLNGTYVGVAYAGNTPQRSAKGDEPTITFRRDGTFTTRNMDSAEVDMEAGTALGAKVGKGEGRYMLSGTDLHLTYTDRLDRKKGNKRHYVIKPLAGPDDAPTTITIQGKLFTLQSQG